MNEELLAAAAELDAMLAPYGVQLPTPLYLQLAQLIARLKGAEQ